MVTFGDRLARFVFLGFLALAFLIFVRSVFGPNSVAREIGRAINQGKISKAVVISCGDILIEVIPDNPAIQFHIHEMNSGTSSDVCGRKDYYSNQDTNLASTSENKTIFKGLEQFADDLRWDFLVWSPFSGNIISHGIYLYEQDSDKVFAIYVAQFPSSDGAVASWRYANSKWTLESLEYTMASSFYSNARKLLTTDKTGPR